jgi:predicted nucleic acid-binding protein
MGGVGARLSESALLLSDGFDYHVSFERRETMKVYLDTSVYNRPFDEQAQPRIWLETIAFSISLQFLKAGAFKLIASSVVAFENQQNPFPERRQWVERCLAFAKQSVVLHASIKNRALELEEQGIKPLDALHLASAESIPVDYFLTCDDRMLKRYRGNLMTVCNPVEFVVTITEEDEYHEFGYEQ